MVLEGAGCGIAEVGPGHPLKVGELRGAFAEEVGIDGAGGGLQNIGDDLAEMFLGMGDVHFLVVTEQGSGPGLFLKEIGQAGSTPSDVVFNLVARRAEAVAGLSSAPRFGDIGPDMVEAVQRVLDAGVCGEFAGFDVQNPAIFGPNIFEDQLVIDRLLRNQLLGKLTTRHSAGRGTRISHKIVLAAITVICS